MLANLGKFFFVGKKAYVVKSNKYPTKRGVLIFKFSRIETQAIQHPIPMASSLSMHFKICVRFCI